MPIYEPVEIVEPKLTSHTDLLYNIKNDTCLLAEIEAVIGAPLLFTEDTFRGFPFIAVLPSQDVVVHGLTYWAQDIAVFLRPAHNDSDANWIFEAFNLSNSGIVTVQPHTTNSTPLEGSFTMRIYYAGAGEGMHGAWDEGFYFAERKVVGENWAADAIQYIRDVTGIILRDMWLEGNVLHIKQSPIEALIAWGPASYRRTLLYLTGASLPGVEYVFLTDADGGSFKWAEWGDDDRNWEYTGHKVLRGHHWAWSGIGEQADEVLKFFEGVHYAELTALAEQIYYESNGQARIFYLYVGATHYAENFHRIWYGELWPDENSNFSKRIERGVFYVNPKQSKK